jgi:hypothetical protein
MRLYLRMPKRGFKNIFKLHYFLLIHKYILHLHNLHLVLL